MGEGRGEKGEENEICSHPLPTIATRKEGGEDTVEKDEHQQGEDFPSAGLNLSIFFMMMCRISEFCGSLTSE